MHPIDSTRHCTTRNLLIPSPEKITPPGNVTFLPSPKPENARQTAL